MNEEKVANKTTEQQETSNPINKVKEEIKEAIASPQSSFSGNVDTIIRLSLILVLSALLIFIVWQFMVSPVIDFKKNEKIVEEAARRYYELNYTQLPSGERVATLSIQQLYDKAFIEEDIYIPNSKKPCDSENSWVKVRKENGEYKYYTYLKCGLQESNVDHQGPEIVLNGKKEITIGLGEKYKDPGVKSVTDDKDGKLNPKDVVVKTSGVNTNEIGEYEVSYIAVDDMSNKTTVKRKVKVIAKLNSTVKKATNNKGYYVGEPNNYLKFSGMLWRIVGIENNNVKIIASEDIANVNYDGIDEWLNYFYKHLTDEAKKLVVKTKYCNMNVTEDNYLTKKCTSYTKAKNAYIISVTDINKATLENENFLKTQTISWTANERDKDNAYSTRIVFYGGTYDFYPDTKQTNYGVRPVITIKGDSLIKSGIGTYERPYDLEETPVGKPDDKLNTRPSGEYINYSGLLWRIVEVNKDGTIKVILNDIVKKEDNIIPIYHDTKSETKIYNPKERGNVGYYINNKVSEYIDTDYFVVKEVKVPIYKKEILYNKETTTKKYKVKFSAPNMYEMFSALPYEQGKLKSYWLINSSQEKYFKAAITDIGVVLTEFGDYDEYGVRVVGNLHKSVFIVKGKGTINNPYIITK